MSDPCSSTKSISTNHLVWARCNFYSR